MRGLVGEELHAPLADDRVPAQEGAERLHEPAHDLDVVRLDVQIAAVRAVAGEDAVVGHAVSREQAVQIADEGARRKLRAAVVVAAVAGEGDAAAVVDEVHVPGGVARQRVRRDAAAAQVEHVALVKRQNLRIQVSAVNHVLRDLPDGPIAHVEPIVPVEFVEVKVRARGPGEQGQVLFVHVDALELVHHARVVGVAVGDDHVVGLVRHAFHRGAQVVIAHAAVDEQRALRAHEQVVVAEAEFVEEIGVLGDFADERVADAHEKNPSFCRCGSDGFSIADFWELRKRLPNKKIPRGGSPRGNLRGDYFTTTMQPLEAVTVKGRSLLSAVTSMVSSRRSATMCCTALPSAS